MGRRSYKRLSISLPVTVSGLDLNGNPFVQTAATIDISAHGLRLRDVPCLRGQRGESVVIKYKRRGARYRVAWIGEHGTAMDGVAGLEAIGDSALIFEEELPADFIHALHPHNDRFANEQSIVPTTALRVIKAQASDLGHGERRRHPRYICSGNVQIWETGHDIAVRARLGELSMGGCYVETMSPFRLGTSLHLELSVKGQAVEMEGVVRNSLPNFGMGIEFIKIQPGDVEKLHRIVAELSGSVRVEEQVTETSDTTADNSIDSILTRWFTSHDLLTRQEFTRLREEGRRSGSEGHLDTSRQYKEIEFSG